MEQSKFYQIKNVTEHEYTLVGCDGSVITLPIQDVDKSASVFTIQDAKDGDVLVCEDFGYTSLMLFESFSNGRISLHCWHNSQTNNFHINTDVALRKDANIHPATKEQHDTLIKAMADAGYIFDFEKKELKKIEQKTAKEYSFNIESELFHQLTPAQQGLWKKEIEQAYNAGADTQKPAAWREEDSPYYDDICEILINLLHSETTDINKDAVQKDLDWFKSLRPQSQWKPSDEQMEALKDALNDAIWQYDFKGSSIKEEVTRKHAETIESLYNDLKKLREE